MYTYQQDSLQYSDQTGDYLLHDLRQEFSDLNRLSKMLTGRLNELLIEDRSKFEFYQNELEYSSKDTNDTKVEIHLESTSRPFTSKALYNNLINSIERYNSSAPSPARMGQCHKWSREFKNDANTSIKIRSMGKLLTALSLGVTSQYLSTGKEIDLKNWILSQENRSVTLSKIFYESLLLNNGDIYLSSLTIENVLSRYWRAKNRESLELTQKLSSITTILNDSGDIFGSWYHLWGMMTYGMCYGSAKSYLMGAIETIGSHFSYSFAPEPQQDYINEMAGPVGAKLAKTIDNLGHSDSVKLVGLDFPKKSFNYLKATLEGDELHLKSNFKKLRYCHLLINTYDQHGARLHRDFYLFKTIPSKSYIKFKIEDALSTQKIHVALDKCFTESI